MNIENNFNSAEVYLEMAKEKVARQDYVGALTELAHAYSHTRELMSLVFKLYDLKIEVESTKGD